MLNLAAFNYRRALAESGGPIAKIVSAPVSIYGHSLYQADAFLTPDLSPHKPELEKCAQADGTGSNESPSIARHMAVSEAIERWAFHSEYAGPHAQRYGFEHDCSPNGMAAYPGLFKIQARSRARLEALGLLALVAWWDGRIAASPTASSLDGINILRLHHPCDFGEVVIGYRKSRSGHVGYGYAAGDSLANATARAIVQLARNELVITCYKICSRTKPIGNYLERRCLYFATPEGHQEFLARLATAPNKTAPIWDPFYDGEIIGPWSRYATVWRTALRMPTHDFLDPRLDFFYW